MRKLVVAVDGFEGLAQVVGERIGGHDRLPSGLDLYGAVSAGGFDEFPDGPAGSCLDPAADGEGCEHHREVGPDGVALAVVDGPFLQVGLRDERALALVPGGGEIADMPAELQFIEGLVTGVLHMGGDCLAHGVGLFSRRCKGLEIVTQLVTTAPVSGRLSATTSDSRNALTCRTRPSRTASDENARAWHAEGQRSTWPLCGRWWSGRSRARVDHPVRSDAELLRAAAAAV